MRKFLLETAIKRGEEATTGRSSNASLAEPLAVLNSEFELFDLSALCDAPRRTAFVTTLRHPIDRIVSMFHYEVRGD